MRVQLSAILCVCAILAVGAVASADSTVTILPGDASVKYSANIDNAAYYVSSSCLDLATATSWASAATYTGSNPLFGLQAENYYAGGYADAGIVLFMDGSLKLGQIKSVTMTDAGGSTKTPIVNLWLDSSKNGNFFAFSGDLLTGLDGDSYFSGNVAGNINQSTHFYGMGELGKGTSFSLEELQNGAVSGIDANTPVALWIGVNSPGTPAGAYMANIGQVTVTTPEPATLSLLALGALGLIRRKK